MNRDDSSKRSGKRRLIPLLATSVLLAGCGAETDASAAANAAQGHEAGASAQPTAAPASLPPAALSAWETYARNKCALDDARFARVTFAPMTGTGDALAQVESLFEAGRGGFITAEFNGDGRPDFIVVTEGHGCVIQGPPYGNAGPPNSFILSTANGYQVVDGFDGWISPAMLNRRGDRDVLDLPGGFNGRCGPVTTVTWGWTGNGIDTVERRNDSGQRVDREGCAQTSAAPQTNGATAALPVETGFYANGGAGNGSCADAIEQKFFAYWDGTHIEALGGNRYRIRVREVEAAEVILNDRIFTANSRTSLTEQYGARWTHCPTAQIPPSVLQYVRRELGLQ